ncbi:MULTISPECIES: Flp pilus assembly protein CpaB [unclassified Clostridioides]|uniref:Flp pilus assembly protein CpaB n=1 Tax=unclassified Clostridioides TaxID=2635829 RepID=UPI001D1110C7|nr:Flp pilus assembly protein CpaB [Clostridioides sp. ZZV14-6048]MCC0739976.1 Flp pilus assembly protein CpaB [Clostridioides sp. ZZV14-5902]HEK5054483.1 Flp pilus assembly protein CpaB [Clostridioides difficile]
MNFLKEKLRNRKVLGVICIVLAIFFGYLTPYYTQKKSETTFVRVISDINRGDKITSNQVREINTSDSKSLPSTIIKNKETVIGKYATVDMKMDDNILKNKISMRPVSENEYLYNLNGDKQAISITIKNFAAGLSGKLQTGDVISIIASDYGENKETISPKELRYVRVLAVTNAKGADKENDKIKNEEKDEQELPTTITVLANETQANLLASLEEESKIHVALAYRGTDKNADKFIEEQDRTINKLKLQTNE